MSLLVKDDSSLYREKPWKKRKKKMSEMEEEKGVKSILEKLSPLNIEQVCEQIKNIDINSAATLAGLVSLIYYEALKKPFLYSNLCSMLAEAGELPEFNEEESKNVSFKRLLVDKCLAEFERNNEEKGEEARRQMMGNVRLIEDLFRIKFFPEKMMNHCVVELVGKQDQDPDDDHIEALLDILLSPIDKKRKQLKSILKQLNHENIEQVSERIKRVEIDSRFILRDLVYQIYCKGLEEPALCATICFGLAADLPAFTDEDDETTINFRRLLLNKCLGDFQRGMKARADDDEEESEEEKKKKKDWNRKRMLSNINLIGELYRNKMLTQRIIHQCIEELLGEEDKNPDEEVVEALCILMSTIGEMIDTFKAQKLVDAYFDVMTKLSNEDDEKISSRVKSMLRDVIELREKQRQTVNQEPAPEKMMNCCVMEGQEIDDDDTKARGILLKSTLKDLNPRSIEEVNERMKNVNISNQHGQCSTGIQEGLISSHQIPLRIMHKAEKRYEVGEASSIEDAKQRKLKAILNKMTPQNFNKLFEQIKDLNIDNVNTLTGIVSQIFDKALTESDFCEMSAKLCLYLASELPDFSVDNEKITFKRLLLNKCQEEFERGEREEAEADRVEVEGGENKLSEEEREEKKVRASRRIRLIGELYKQKMLTERIMHECIKKLLGTHQNPYEEDVEALCILMSTIGEMIDHPKAKEHMDAYFDMMMKLSINEKLSSRVRSMLRDVIELRKKQWQKVDMDSKQDSRWSRGSSSTSWVRRGQPTRGSTTAFYPRTQQRGGIGGRPPPKWRKIQVSKRVEEVHGNLRHANDLSAGCVQGGSSTEIENVSSEAKVTSEECLREMSIAAIREFYSARDEKEVVLCIKELSSPGFYPFMVSQWVIDSFERKEIDRDLLAKLLINLRKSQEPFLSQEQLIKGFESVLSSLENAIIDAPNSAKYLGHILAKLILENVLTLEELGRLIHEASDKPGRLVQTGLASEILGCILKIIRTEKGHSILNEIDSSSDLWLENLSLLISSIRGG